MHFRLLIVLCALAAFNNAFLMNYNLIDFLLDVQRLHGFDKILLVQNRNTSFASQFIQNIKTLEVEKKNDIAARLNFTQVSDIRTEFLQRMFERLKVCVLHGNELGAFQLRRHFNEAIISVVYIDGALEDHTALLKAFAAALYHMRQTKILFLINYMWQDGKDLLHKLFKYAWQQKMINAVALFRDYQESATFYSYTPFPNFTIESKPILLDSSDRTQIYPYRLGNLHGYKLNYILGGTDPRIIIYNRNGRAVVGGFVGHLLRSFARKFNCKLTEHFPARSNSFAPAQQLIEAVRNGTVDFSAGLTFPSIPMAGFTYPYEQINFCLMMAVEADIPSYDFFWIVFERGTFIITLAIMFLISLLLSIALYGHGYHIDWLDLILHDNCLRGVLGQSFSELRHAPTVVRFIYLQICVLGILLTTSYNSYFATYWTSAPKVAPLRTFDDILHSGTKVLAYGPEHFELIGRTDQFKKYVSMFHIEMNFEKYIQTRNSFNTQYAYTVPTTKWIIFKEQQKIFTTPIFHFRTDLCLNQNVPLGLPVQDNSPYIEMLYQIMLETDQAGLGNYWRDYAFLELIMVGKLKFVDLSRKNQFKPMKVADLHYICMGMGMMGIVVTLVFLGEVCTYHRRRAREILNNVWRRVFCSGGIN